MKGVCKAEVNELCAALYLPGAATWSTSKTESGSFFVSTCVLTLPRQIVSLKKAVKEDCSRHVTIADGSVTVKFKTKAEDRCLKKRFAEERAADGLLRRIRQLKLFPNLERLKNRVKMSSQKNQKRVAKDLDFRLGHDKFDCGEHCAVCRVPMAELLPVLRDYAPLDIRKRFGRELLRGILPKCKRVTLEKSCVSICSVKWKREMEDMRKTMKSTTEIGEMQRIQGNEHFSECRFEKAIAAYSLAIELNASDFRAFLNRSFCNLKLGKLDDALEDANQAIAANPLEAKCYARKAMTLKEMGHLQYAVSLMKKAAFMRPDIEEYSKWIQQIQH